MIQCLLTGGGFVANRAAEATAEADGIRHTTQLQTKRGSLLRRKLKSGGQNR